MAATHTALFIWISLHWQTRLMSTCLHITTCGWIRMDVPVSQCCMLLRKLSHLILQFLKKVAVSLCALVHECRSQDKCVAQLSPPLVLWVLGSNSSLCHWVASTFTHWVTSLARNSFVLPRIFYIPLSCLYLFFYKLPIHILYFSTDLIVVDF